jgi:hypothetical protein
VEIDVGSMERSMERMELPRSRTTTSQRAPWLLRDVGLQDAARRRALSPTLWAHCRSGRPEWFMVMVLVLDALAKRRLMSRANLRSRAEGTATCKTGCKG